MAAVLRLRNVDTGAGPLTANALYKLTTGRTGAEVALQESLISDDGTTVRINGDLVVTGSGGGSGGNGSSVNLTVQSSPQTAPGAGIAILRWEAGTNAGTLKLVAYAGTSTTGVTLIDNVGAGS